MIIDSLPGEKHPYFLRAGEGERHLFGGQLAARIARNEDTGGLLEASVVSGAKGSAFPMHSHLKSREALLVLDGRLELFLNGRACLLSSGDFANIPAGIVHGYRMQSHRTRFLTWNVDGDAGGVYAALGRPYDGFVYPPDGNSAIQDKFFSKAEARMDIRFSGDELPPPGSCVSCTDELPKAVAPYVLESGDGERLIGGDSLFTFLAHQGNSDGQFIALTTQGPTSPRIPNHYHERHTETFFCLDGAMTMWADGHELAMSSGDFLHVPAGTIHSFRLDARYTSFVGILAPGLFEPFFRTLCDPYEPYIFPQEPGPLRFDRVLQHLHELDLKLVGPGGPPQG